MSELERALLESEAFALPAPVRRLVALLAGSDADLRDVTDAIAADAGLAARFLRLANCWLVNPAEEAQSVPGAVAALGARESCCASVGLALMGALRQAHCCEGLDLVFRTALARALAARRLGTATGDWHAHEAFLTGLAADAAIPVMCGTLPGYGDYIERFHRGEGELVTFERANLGTDHGALSPVILAHMGFPARVIDPIRHHHAQLEATGDIERRGAILGAADRLARALCIDSLAGEIHGLDRSLSTRVGVPGSRVARIAADLPDQIRELADIFDVPARSQRNYVEVLADADRSAAGLAGPDLDALELLPATGDGFRSFDPEALSDTPLERDDETGMLERCAFERMLELFNRRARQLRRPLSLLVLAIENLKEIEASSGPAVASAVVVEIAQRIKVRVRRSDPTARVAPGQLAVLAPGCSQNHAPHMATRVRLCVEADPVETEAGPIHVQLAIGTAASLPHHDSVAPLSLLHSACASLASAKS